MLISGERSPITLALLRGLKRGLIAFSDSPVHRGRLSIHSSQTSKNDWMQRKMEFCLMRPKLLTFLNPQHTRLGQKVEQGSY